MPTAKKGIAKVAASMLVLIAIAGILLLYLDAKFARTLTDKKYARRKIW